MLLLKGAYFAFLFCDKSTIKFAKIHGKLAFSSKMQGNESGKQDMNCLNLVCLG